MALPDCTRDYLNCDMDVDTDKAWRAGDTCSFRDCHAPILQPFLYLGVGVCFHHYGTVGIVLTNLNDQEHYRYEREREALARSPVLALAMIGAGKR